MKGVAYGEMDHTPCDVKWNSGITGRTVCFLLFRFLI